MIIVDLSNGKETDVNIDNWYNFFEKLSKKLEDCAKVEANNVEFERLKKKLNR